MSSDSKKPLRPTLASNRTARTPITPRIAPTPSPSTKSIASPAAPSVRSEPPTPRGKLNTPLKDALVGGNVTPRSSARTSKSGSANASPIGSTRPRSIVVTQSDEHSNAGASQESSERHPRPGSFVATGTRVQSPLVRSPEPLNPTSSSADEPWHSQFFHASDGPKQESANKKAEPQKKAQFFHADGKQEASFPATGSASPVFSATSEQRSAGPWIRSGDQSQASVDAPMLSPALSATSATSPFFLSSAVQSARQHSPPQSKENIHLSYRKGVSQLIGIRANPAPRSTVSSNGNEFPPGERQGNLEQSALGSALSPRSPSLSSIDSGNSIQARRKSTAWSEQDALSSIHVSEIQSSATAHRPRVLEDLPSIDTSLQSPAVLSRTESGLSATKAVSDMAADARRERKVLDLEISNSSLLSINTALEREVRRQKTELKRFRRLSRAGRFSLSPGERGRGRSEDLDTLDEEDEHSDDYGFPSGSFNEDDMSDDDESVVSSAGPLSPMAEDRLAKDEKRLRVDLAKHKELLVQSQAMNQSIKRCMYAAEDMLRDGRKALEYQVRVSDVKLGGRVLSTHGDTEAHREIEVEDDVQPYDDPNYANGLLEVWSAAATYSHEGSEGGDRDSGIEVDRHAAQNVTGAHSFGDTSGSNRPPGPRDIGRFMSFSHELDG